MAEYSLGEAALGTAVDLSGLDKGIEDAESRSQSGFSRIGGIISGVLKTALIGAGIAIAAGFGMAISEASEAQAGLAQLDAVLESTGGKAGVTRDQVIELSSSLSASNGLSKFADDAVLSAENMLLTFTNIGSSVFPDATQATLDMSAALKKPPEDMAVMVGKALNSADGISALQRVGVSFTDSQVEMAKHLFETGHVVEYQRMVLAELASEFGGSAANAANTFSGHLTTLRERFNDVAESAGDRLIPGVDAVVTALSSPAVMSAISSIADALAGALAGAMEFLSTSVIPALITAWSDIGPTVMAVASIFVDVAGQAFSWGYNIIAQLANGIAAAVGEVVSALSGIGATIAGWLEPGSPPRLLPNLDQWGSDAATVYMQAWTRGDFSSFSSLGSTIEGLLKSMVDVGQVQPQDLISLLFGSREALAAAVEQIRTTGDLSEETLNRIRAAAGPAADQVEALVRKYAAAEEASQALAKAQADLKAITDQYDSSLDGLNSTLDENKHQHDELDAQEKALKSQTMIPVAELNAIAQRRLALDQQRIATERQIDQTKREKSTAIDAAQAKINAAKQAADLAADQYQAQQSLIQVQRENNALLKQQMDLQQKAKAGGGKGGKGDADKAKREAKAAAEAQWRFNYAAADTDGKLKMLQDRLATLNPTQAEYWSTLGQITGLQQQQAREQQQVADAQWAYNYGVADTNGKLAMLKDKLAGLDPSQKEYWSVLGQIHQLEEQTNKTHKGHAGALKGIGDAAAGSLPHLRAIPKPIQDTTTAMDAMNQKATEIKSQITGFFGAIADNIQSRVSGITTTIGGTVSAIVAPFAAVGTFIETTTGPALTSFFQQVGEGVQNILPVWDSLVVTFQKVAPVVAAISGAIITFLVGSFNVLLGLIGGALPGVFMAADGIIHAFLGVLNLIADVFTGVVSIVGALLRGDFAGAWNAAGDLVKNIAADVLQVIGGLVEGVIGLVGGLVGGVIGFFRSLYMTLVGGSIVPELAAGIIGVITTMKERFISLVSALVSSVISFFSNLASEVGGKIATMVSDAQSKWEGLKSRASEIFESIKSAIATKIEEAKAAFTTKIGEIAHAAEAIAGRLRSAGQAIVQAIKDGIAAEWDRLVRWFASKLQELRDKLPFSEPRDHSSPLYGLGRSGEAIVTQIQSGIGVAGSLMAPPLRMPGVPGSGLSAAGAMAGGAGMSIDVQLTLIKRGLEDLIDARIDKKQTAAGNKAATRERMR